MSTKEDAILAEIDAFLSETEMGVSYFGKISTGNSELVPRLRAGGRIWPETSTKVRNFIKQERKRRSKSAASAEMARSA